MIDLQKRLIDCTLEDMVEAVMERLNEVDDEPVTTQELMKRLKCSKSQIKVYGDAGMYKDPSCRLGHNKWDAKACKIWTTTVYQEKLSKAKARPLVKNRK